MNRKNDQLQTPQPPVVFVTKEAADRIVADLRAKYEDAARYATAQGGLAVQLGEEISQLEREISEKQVWAIQRDGEKRTAEAEARAARDVAKGYADVLAAAGVHVPPPNGELSYDPDGNIERLGAAHAELNAGGLS